MQLSAKGAKAQQKANSSTHSPTATGRLCLVGSASYFSMYTRMVAPTEPWVNTNTQHITNTQEDN
jgi:hypothetical protein